jgi:hypothetical protein
MAAGTGEEAGERVPCPSCARVVLQKAMIPVLAAGDAASPTYLCVDCARTTAVATRPTPTPA